MEIVITVRNLKITIDAGSIQSTDDAIEIRRASEVKIEWLREDQDD